MSLVRYKILDQFGVLLPAAVDLHEEWLTAVTSDYGGENWTRGSADGWSQQDPLTFYDLISVAGTGTPQPQNPQTRRGTVKVDHWGQQFRVGSTSQGSGACVQCDTLQRYQDHGAHLPYP